MTFLAIIEGVVIIALCIALGILARPWAGVVERYVNNSERPGTTFQPAASYLWVEVHVKEGFRWLAITDAEWRRIRARAIENEHDRTEKIPVGEIG